MRLLLLSGALLFTGCGFQNAKSQHAYDVFQCRVHAIKPLIGDVFDAEILVRDAIQGKVDLVAIMQTLGTDKQDIVAAAAAWKACDPSVPALTETKQVVFNL